MKKRINGFDSLRAVAMWLGVVLHAVIAYKTVPVSGWPRDAQNSFMVFDYLYDFIHTFRMPLFFLVAGFFANMIVERSGIRYFVEQRIRRILVPFVLGVIFIVPATLFPFNFYKYHYINNFSRKESLSLAFKSMFTWGGVAHLWFLYYLLLYYIFFISIGVIVRRVSRDFGNMNFRGWKLGSFKAIVTLIIFTLFGIFVSFGEDVPSVYTGLRLKYFQLTYYFVFFGTGILLYRRMHFLNNLKEWGVRFLYVGLLIELAFFSGVLDIGDMFRFFLKAVSTVFLVLGFCGFFIARFKNQSPIWAYFSDSAYWVYLVHMGFVAFFQVFFLESSVPPLIRPILVFLSTMCLCLISYALFVRYTFLGNLLHGKRVRPLKS